MIPRQHGVEPRVATRCHIGTRALVTKHGVYDGPANVYGGIGVQRGHLRVGHELCDEHAGYVL